MSGEGLAFPRLHLRDHAAQQRASADELDVEGALSEAARRGLADDRERARDEIVAETVHP